jgi:PAS domain S-box-containing protein
MFRQFAENIPQVVWMTKSDPQQVAYVSPAYEQVFGRSREALYASSHDWLAAVHEEDRPRVQTALIAMESGGGFDEEYRVVRPDGAIRWMHDRGVPICDERGAIDRYVGFAEDITERKQVEEERARHQVELMHASRLSTVGQMVANLSHEVAQPLSAISNFAAACVRILESAPPAGMAGAQTAELTEYIAAIVKQNQRCRGILERLRDFSSRGPRLSRCDCNEILRDSVELTAFDLRQQRVSVHFDLEESLPSVFVDRVQMQQVLVNLLINARDAVCDSRAERREITLRSRATPRAVLLEVEDTGSGFSEAALRHMFEPFFTTKPHGTGIGLSICQSIIKDHGGEIEACCNRHGGSTLRIRLPVN